MPGRPIIHNDKGDLGKNSFENEGVSSKFVLWMQAINFAIWWTIPILTIYVCKIGVNYLLYNVTTHCYSLSLSHSLVVSYFFERYYVLLYISKLPLLRNQGELAWCSFNRQLCIESI